MLACPSEHSPSFDLPGRFTIAQPPLRPLARLRSVDCSVLRAVPARFPYHQEALERTRLAEKLALNASPPSGGYASGYSAAGARAGGVAGASPPTSEWRTVEPKMKRCATDERRRFACCCSSFDLSRLKAPHIDLQPTLQSALFLSLPLTAAALWRSLFLCTTGAPAEGVTRRTSGTAQRLRKCSA